MVSSASLALRLIRAFWLWTPILATSSSGRIGLVT